jgi:hypothetical protein
MLENKIYNIDIEFDYITIKGNINTSSLYLQLSFHYLDTNLCINMKMHKADFHKVYYA